MEATERSKKRKNSEKRGSNATTSLPELKENSDECSHIPEKPSTIKKRKRFTFQDKARILEELQELSQDSICRKYQISERTFRKWKSQKQIIEEASKNADSKNLKKKTDTHELDSAMYAWLVQTQNIGIPVTGSMMRRQALIESKNLGFVKPFKASEGWLSAWKNRKNIRNWKITDEKLSTDEPASDDSMEPDESESNPSCSKDSDEDKLPDFQCNQSETGMDKISFEQWFVNQFAPQVKNFLESKNLPPDTRLLEDNCKAPEHLEVDDSKGESSPPKLTSPNQPLDQGILQAFRLNYLNNLVHSVLEAKENGISYIEFLKSIAVKEAILWSAEAWDRVEPTTFRRCWNKLWPIEQRDIATQTESDSTCTVSNLDTSKGTETAVHPSNADKIKRLLQLVKEIHECETIDEKTT